MSDMSDSGGYGKFTPKCILVVDEWGEKSNPSGEKEEEKKKTLMVETEEKTRKKKEKLRC
jgi:hypothetical protein